MTPTAPLWLAGLLAQATPPVAPPLIVQHGEVAVVEGTDQLISFDGVDNAVDLPGVARAVIDRFGDHFQTLTVWLTFDETSTRRTEAYQLAVRPGPSGVGLPPVEANPFSSTPGRLRSIVNMKRLWSRVTQDSAAGWQAVLPFWGQEFGHQWGAFLRFRDRRTGAVSDALLGRDCAHWSRLVDSQASVHDGLAWRDNHDGSFDALDERAVRYGNFDLYAMGLLPADEVPATFFIDGIAGYQRPPCERYGDSALPLERHLSGTRVDVSIDDVVAALGPRVPAAHEADAGQPQDYLREAHVLLTRVGETADSSLAVRVADRIDHARAYWQDWVRTASGQRLLVCTQLSADCGDARSDVVALSLDPARGTVSVAVANHGARAATGVALSLAVTAAGATPGRIELTRTLDALAPGQRRDLTVEVALSALGVIPCGSTLEVKAATASDFHRHRLAVQQVATAAGAIACVQSTRGAGGCQLAPGAPLARPSWLLLYLAAAASVFAFRFTGRPELRSKLRFKLRRPRRLRW